MAPDELPGPEPGPPTDPVDPVDDVRPADVAEKAAPVGVMLKRGCRRRCPRCGGGGLFRRWSKMEDRCPRCGFQFEREPGFFVGAMMVNVAVTEGLLGVVVFAFILVKNANADASVWPPLVVGVILAIVLPIVAYPWARTIWSAIDLAMTPLELDEIVAARDWLAGREVTESVRPGIRRRADGGPEA